MVHDVSNTDLSYFNLILITLKSGYMTWFPVLQAEILFPKLLWYGNWTYYSQLITVNSQGQDKKILSNAYLGNMSVFVAGRSLPYSDVCVDITESAVPGLFRKKDLNEAIL